MRNLFKEAINAVFKRIGKSSTKRKIWNREFDSGKWNYLDVTKNVNNGRDTDIIYTILEKYAGGGAILDLGCGTGNTGRELDEKHYSHYTGVDIADIAITRAENFIKSDSILKEKSTFIASDITSFVPTRTHDIILFRESLQYFPQKIVKKMLSHYSEYLASSGYLIVKLFDKHKYISTIQTIEENFEIIQKYDEQDNPVIILIFRPVTKNLGNL